MNPVLLKPVSKVGAQVVLNGMVLRDASAKSYHQHKERLFAESCAALDRLRRRCDVVVMEGAGSCAEVNLMAGDIVNLRMAAYAGAPVVLVADIDRGGVFAQIVGTLACLSPAQQAQISGFIICISIAHDSGRLRPRYRPGRSPPAAPPHPLDGPRHRNL